MTVNKSLYLMRQIIICRHREADNVGPDRAPDKKADVYILFYDMGLQ